jgi:hypothetical protein
MNLYSDLEDTIHQHKHYIQPIPPTYVTEYERAYCSPSNSPKTSPSNTLRKGEFTFDKSFEHPGDESINSPLKLKTKIHLLNPSDEKSTKNEKEKSFNHTKSKAKSKDNNNNGDIVTDKIENKSISQEKVTISEAWLEMEYIIEELNKKGY